MSQCIVTSQNCMYVLTGAMTNVDITRYMDDIIPKVEAEIYIRYPRYVRSCKYKINMPLARGLQPIGYCFLWLTSQPVFMMLSGRDFDGSEIKLTTKITSSTPFEELMIMDWSELPKSHRKIYECDLWKAPDKNEFVPTFKPAQSERISREYLDDTLFCQTSLPPHYTEKDIALLFEPFATSGKITVTKTVTNNAYIKFSRSSDAYFALFMMKKYYDSRNCIMLSFDHAKASNKHSNI